MPSPLPADQPAATPPGRGTVDALISQTRRLMGDVDAVRRDTHGGARSATAVDRWQRALYDLALHQLNDLDEHLAQLREGPPDGPDTAAPDAGPPRGSLLSRVGSAEWNLLTDEASWSAELYRILGRAPGTAPLTLDELPSLVLGPDRPKLTTMVTDCLVDASPIDGEFRLVRPDGTVRTVHMMGEPVLDEDGGTVAMWAVLRDVSELRRSQRTVTDTHVSLTRPRTVAAKPPAPPRPGPVWRAASLRAPDGRPARLDTALYVPAGTGARHPGDWHDVLELADGETLLSCGALRGEGAADTAGAMLLGTLRGMATAGHGPGPLLSLLDGLRTATLPPTTLEAVCCRYLPRTRTLTWASTRGPAPLLFRDGTGRVLGTPDGRFPAPAPAETRESLLPGDVVLLHTGTGTAAHRLLSLAPGLGTAPTAHDCLRALADELTPTAGNAHENTRGPVPERSSDVCALVVRVTG
jgi:PAS domain-containing protein